MLRLFYKLKSLTDIYFQHKNINMKKATLLSRNEMKKITGGNVYVPPHYEPCDVHGDCSSHAPICMATGTPLGGICCDVAAMQPGGVCYNFGNHTPE